ncbi:MAG: hypothetical protein ACP5QY_14305, partial [Candidatus Hydrogenedens sp.]
MNDNIFLNFLLTLLIYIIPIFYIYSEEIKGIKDNTSSLETDIYYNHIEQTIERLKQLKQSVLFELHPSFTEPPSS